MNQHIFLIGMRGAGKTFVGEYLSKLWHKPLIDTDIYLQEKNNSTINEMVKIYGWDYFREQESLVLAEIIKLPPQIISTGGGLPLKENNQLMLKNNGIIIWVDASYNTMLNRINNQTENIRPALTAKNVNDEFLEVYQTRKPIYAKLADYKFINNYHTFKSEIFKLQKSNLFI